ncbi:polysaccharide biosynthesis C-terminal domain-containing protein [candidate division KSB1 bacterium]
MNLIKNSLITFFVTVPATAFSYIITYLLANKLGASGLGDIRLIINNVSLFAFLGGMGFHISTTYYYGQDKSFLNRIFWNTLLYTSGISIVLMSLYHFISPMVLKDIDQSYISKAIPVIFLILATNLLSSIISARLKFIKNGIVTVSQRAVYLLLVLILLYKNNLTINSVLYSFLFSYLISFILGVLFSREDITRPEIDLSLIWKFIKYGVRGHLANVFQRLNFRLDLYIINYFFISEQVGFYTIAVAASEILLFIPRSISTVLFPVVSHFQSTEEAGRYTAQVCRITFVLMTISAAVLLLAGKFLILFFFEDFDRSIMPFYILVPGIVFLSIGYILSNFFSGKGYPEVPTYSAFTALIATIILDLVLIPVYNINGAALASTIAYLIHTVVFIYFFIKRTGLPLSNIIVFRKNDYEILLERLRVIIKL